MHACFGALTVLLTTSCGSSLGTVPGLLGPTAYPPAMVLATGVEGRACAGAFWGLPSESATLALAIARALARVPDATLLVDAEVSSTTVTTGIYNRQCVGVRGSAAKLVSQLVVPGHEGHPGQGHAEGDPH